MDRRNNNEEIVKQYFEYDEIEHYFNDLDPGQEMELYEKRSDSELDSLKVEVILHNLPTDTSDLTFIDRLEAMGYARNEIDSSKFQSINEIFVEKSIGEILDTSCIQVYRDILVFKNRTKVVGVAKICFSCGGHHIVGTKANTSTFGQNGDLDRLFKLIRI